MRFLIPGTDIGWVIKSIYSLDDVTKHLIKYITHINNNTCACCCKLYKNICDLIEDDVDFFKKLVNVDMWNYGTPEQLEEEYGYEGYIGDIEVGFKDTDTKRSIYISRDSYYHHLNTKQIVCEIEI